MWSLQLVVLCPTSHSELSTQKSLSVSQRTMTHPTMLQPTPVGGSCQHMFGPGQLAIVSVTLLLSRPAFLSSWSLDCPTNAPAICARISGRLPCSPILALGRFPRHGWQRSFPFAAPSSGCAKSLFWVT